MSSNLFGFYGGSLGNVANNFQQQLANYVTLNTSQTITGEKTFTASISSNSVIVYGGALTLNDTADPVNSGTLAQSGLNTVLTGAAVPNGKFVVYNQDSLGDYKVNLDLSLGVSGVKGTQFNVVENTGFAKVQMYPSVRVGTSPNPLVSSYDSAVCGGYLATTQNTFSLTVNSTTTSGVRIKNSEVMMGAGGSSVNPSSYLYISNGQAAVSVGPAVPNGDITTKIATTAWVMKNAASRGRTSLYTFNTNVPSIIYDDNLTALNPMPGMYFISMTENVIGQAYYIELPNDFTNIVNGHTVTIRWYHPTADTSPNWAVCSPSPHSAQTILGGLGNPQAVYSLTGYVAATFVTDLTYWYLVSRV